jgi:hypothetical protein
MRTLRVRRTKRGKRNFKRLRKKNLKRYKVEGRSIERLKLVKE